MTVSFESIVKSEKSLPEGPKNHLFFPRCPKSLSWIGKPDETKTIAQIKGKRSATAGKVVLPSMTKNQDSKKLSVPRNNLSKKLVVFLLPRLWLDLAFA